MTTPPTDKITAWERIEWDLARGHPDCEVLCNERDCDAQYESLLDLVCADLEESL